MNELRHPDFLRQQCLIDGDWLDADNRAMICVRNPATGDLIGHVPDMGAAETEYAIIAAANALPAWRGTPAPERALILRRWADLVVDYAGDLAAIVTAEQGKPLAEAFGETLDAADCLECSGDEARRVLSDAMPVSAPIPTAGHRLSDKESIGVCAAITSWKSPIVEVTRAVAPALAAGCTIVVMPSDKTPFSALALAALAKEAGVPAGVFSVITGKQAIVGAEMIAHPDVQKLTCFGAVPVDKTMDGTAAKIAMEPDGGAPFIVFDDADIDAAVHDALVCRFRSSGQARLSANRIYVQNGIYDRFAEKLIAAVKNLKTGNGVDKGITQGPLIDAQAVEKTETHIADALGKGATLALGGKRHPLGGHYFEPTVLLNANAGMLLASEPAAGPLAALFRFDSDAHAIAAANATDGDIAGYFYTRDIGRAWQAAGQLAFGTVGINTISIASEAITVGTPRSEGSRDAIDAYLARKPQCTCDI